MTFVDIRDIRVLCDYLTTMDEDGEANNLDVVEHADLVNDVRFAMRFTGPGNVYSGMWLLIVATVMRALGTRVGIGLDNEGVFEFVTANNGDMYLLCFANGMVCHSLVYDYSKARAHPWLEAFNTGDDLDPFYEQGRNAAREMGLEFGDDDSLQNWMIEQVLPDVPAPMMKVRQLAHSSGEIARNADRVLLKYSPECFESVKDWSNECYDVDVKGTKVLRVDTVGAPVHFTRGVRRLVTNLVPVWGYTIQDFPPARKCINNEALMVMEDLMRALVEPDATYYYQIQFSEYLRGSVECMKMGIVMVVISNAGVRVYSSIFAHLKADGQGGAMVCLNANPIRAHDFAGEPFSPITVDTT